MTDWINLFFERIDKLQPDSKPAFGKMNVSQMLCHCADQIRIINGELNIEVDKSINPEEVVLLVKAGKSVQAPKGLDQSKGEGTMPTTFENDRVILKKIIADYDKLPSDFEYGIHPFFGEIDKKQWHKLVIHHLNHHLSQFGV
jgi:Protein of unknown function (DUF1569)